MVAHFTDGSLASGSLLVGADGTKSRVRKQLLPGKGDGYVDTEQRWIYGKTHITRSLLNELHPHICKELALVQDRSGSFSLSLIVEPIRSKDTRSECRAEFELPDDYMY